MTDDMDASAAPRPDEFPHINDNRAGWRVAMAIRDTLQDWRLSVEDITPDLDPVRLGHLYGLAEALTVVWPELRRFAPTRDVDDDARQAREIITYALLADGQCQAWAQRNHA